MIVETIQSIALGAGTALMVTTNVLAVQTIRKVKSSCARDEAVRAREEAEAAEAEKRAKSFETAQVSMNEFARKLASGATVEEAAKVAGIKVMSPAEVAADLKLMPCADPNCPECKGKRGDRHE